MNKEPTCVDSYSISYVGFFCPWKYILFMDFFDHSFFGGRNSWKGKWKDTFFLGISLNHLLASLSFQWFLPHTKDKSSFAILLMYLNPFLPYISMHILHTTL